MSFALAACAGDDLEGEDAEGGASEDRGQVTLSGQSFDEAALVASMYEQLLENEGFSVEAKLVTSRDQYINEIGKSVDIVPEYVSGIVDLLNTLENGADAEPITTPDGQETAEAAADLLEGRGITLLEQSEATDTNAFFVTSDYSESNGVTKLSDLKDKSVVLAAAPDCKGRPDCEGGLTGTYGINVTKILPLGFGGAQTFESVRSGESQLGLTATTDGSVEEQGMVLLEDDMGIQPAQNLVPAVSDEFLSDNPDVEDLLNELMGELTTEELADLNYQVTVERQKAEDVAEQFLEDAGLL